MPIAELGHYPVNAESSHGHSARRHHHRACGQKWGEGETVSEGGCGTGDKGAAGRKMSPGFLEEPADRRRGTPLQCGDPDGKGGKWTLARSPPASDGKMIAVSTIDTLTRCRKSQKWRRDLWVVGAVADAVVWRGWHRPRLPTYWARYKKKFYR